MFRGMATNPIGVIVGIPPPGTNNAYDAFEKPYEDNHHQQVLWNQATTSHTVKPPSLIRSRDPWANVRSTLSPIGVNTSEPQHAP